MLYLIQNVFFCHISCSITLWNHDQIIWLLHISSVHHNLYQTTIGKLIGGPNIHQRAEYHLEDFNLDNLLDYHYPRNTPEAHISVLPTLRSVKWSFVTFPNCSQLFLVSCPTSAENLMKDFRMLRHVANKQTKQQLWKHELHRPWR